MTNIQYSGDMTKLWRQGVHYTYGAARANTSIPAVPTTHAAAVLGADEGRGA